MDHNLKNCSVCSGKGKTITKVVHIGKSESEFEMDCIWCDGTGKMTDQEIQEHKEYQEMWCKCEDVGHNVKFYDNGEHPEISKHHYRHTVCGKVVQIG